jgi:hypothetical protein
MECGSLLPLWLSRSKLWDGLNPGAGGAPLNAEGRAQKIC